MQQTVRCFSVFSPFFIRLNTFKNFTVKLSEDNNSKKEFANNKQVANTNQHGFVFRAFLI